MRYCAEINGQKLEFDANFAGDSIVAEIAGQEVRATVTRLAGSGRYAVLLGNRSFELEVHRNAAGTWVTYGGRAYHCRVADARQAALAHIGTVARPEHRVAELRAAMPGLVVEVRVRPGDTVHAGQGVVIVEAMKMENELRAPCTGVVKEVKVREKQSVEQNQLLVVFA